MESKCPVPFKVSSIYFNFACACYYSFLRVFFLIPFMLNNWNPSIRNMVFFSFIYSDIYSSINSLLFSFFFWLWSNTIIMLYILQIITALRDFFRLTSVSFWWYAPSLLLFIYLFSKLLLFDITKGYMLILCLSCTNSRFSHFFNNPWLHLLENGIYHPRFGCWVSSLLLGILLFLGCLRSSIGNMY